MSFVDLNIEEDFEYYNWDIIENTDTEFQAQIGSWTISARNDGGMFTVELFKNEWPMFEDGFYESAATQGAILALRQVLMKMTNGNPDWPQC
jgi:hypothetical protein